VSAEERQRFTRPRPNVARYVTPATPSLGGFVYEAEARSCAEVLYREGLPNSDIPFETEATYNLTALSRIMVREGANIRLLPGEFGRIVLRRAGGAIPLTQVDGVVEPGASNYQENDALLNLIARFCASPRAAGTRP